MTQEQKDLLLKDLCARLPYKVKVQDTYYKSLEPAPIWLLDLNAQCVRLFADEGYQSIEYIKPYLFPLSSMTEEQKKYIDSRWGVNENFDFEIDPNWGRFVVELGDTIDFINWLIENHFDFNGLIPMGMALDATGLNIY